MNCTAHGVEGPEKCIAKRGPWSPLFNERTPRGDRKGGPCAYIALLYNAFTPFTYSSLLQVTLLNCVTRREVRVDSCCYTPQSAPSRRPCPRFHTLRFHPASTAIAPHLPSTHSYEPTPRFYTSKLTAGASPFLHHHHHCRLHPRHTAVKFMKRLLHMRLLAVACVAAELTLSPSNQDARATTFSAFPLVQRDLRAADVSCSPDPLFRPRS